MPLFRNTPQLLVAFREGTPAALENVYRYYVRPLDGYLRALARVVGAPDLSQPSAVADLLQEVFIRAFSTNSRMAYDGLREFAPYLNTIARNCFFDALRKRRKEVLIAPEDLPLTADDATDQLAGYDPKVVAVLDAYLSELPPRLKGIYEQRFERGLSQEAACETLGVSRRTLRTGEEHLRRGLRKALLLAGALDARPGVTVTGLQATGQPW
jgi:RNA polymerase sigma factor (sigma-70 family)